MVSDDGERLLQNVNQKMPIWQWYRRSKNPRKIYRDVTGNPTGMVVFSTNLVHPQALGMAVYAPNKTLFSEILGDARQAAERAHKIRLVIWEYPPFSAFTEWLLTQGFSVWRQTVEPVAELSTILPATISGQTATLNDVLADARLTAQLLKQSQADYAQVHKVNPVAAMTTEQWRKIVLPDVLTTVPMVALHDGRISAYTFPFEDEPKVLTLAWMGAQTLPALWQLQSAQIRWAKQRGMRRLTGEFDSTDPVAWATARHWPFAPAPTYTMIGRQLSV